MNGLFSSRLKKILLMAVAALLLYNACVELYNIAWDTGEWLGQFSPKWALLLFIFAFACILSFGGIGVSLWAPQTWTPLIIRLAILRHRLGFFRYVIAILLLATPVYVLQYTFWGIVLHGPYLRIVLICLSIYLLGFLFTVDEKRLVDWAGASVGALLLTGVGVCFSSLAQVTDYPFSLGWSEGNRLWDYSIMFGRHLYDYPDGKEIPVYLDVGRQFIGGIPFLLSRVTIWQERLWLSLMSVIPYLIFGWVSFRLNKKDILPWGLAGIWAFTFVKQGPIHPPLLLCAIIVAFTWGRSLWLAVPLIIGASLFAVTSRSTWLFAPGMWAVMLEMGSPIRQAERLDKETWLRVFSVGLAGIAGGYMLPFLVPVLTAWINAVSGQTFGIPGGISGGVTSDSVMSSISSQPLLWYRLLPNETFEPGILIGLILAVGPISLILIHLIKTRQWIINGWQKAAIVLPLLAFLVVGLIVSTKIGGGGDLHNMDMFIIGLTFTCAIAWRNGGRQWIDKINIAPGWIQILVMASILIPSYWAFLGLRPISVTRDVKVVALLADIPPLFPSTDVFPDPLPGFLPSKDDTYEALNGIRAEVERAAPLGEILFMDQRQLLTFGYITEVPLVPEYDKKVLIDKALSSDAKYFEDFYRDLAAQRFSLIITNPLHERIKTDAAEFGEENNAWVKWVSTPILCYYEPLYTLRKVTVQILGPRQDISDCSQALP